METSEFEALLRAEEYDVLVRKLDADIVVPEHEHAWDVHALILEGEFTITTETGNTTHRAGDTFRLAAGVRHRERHGPDGVRLLLGRRHTKTSEGNE